MVLTGIMSNPRHTDHDRMTTAEFAEKRVESKNKFKSKMDKIIKKYTAVEPEGHDVIDLETLEIVEDYGEIRNMKRIPIGSYVSQDKERKNCKPTRLIYKKKGKGKSGHYSISPRKTMQQDLLEKTTEKLMNLELTERKKKIFHIKKKVCRPNHISQETTFHTPVRKNIWAFVMKPTPLKEDLNIDDVSFLLSPSKENSSISRTPPSDKYKVCGLNQTKSTDGCLTPVNKQRILSLAMNLSPFTPKEKESPKKCKNRNSDQKKSSTHAHKQKILSLTMKPHILTPKGIKLEDIEFQKNST